MSVHTFSYVQPYVKSMDIANCLEEPGSLEIVSCSCSSLLAPAPQLKFTWRSLEARVFVKGIHVSQTVAQSSSRLFYSVLAL